MKTSMDRKPLILSIVILAVLVVITYLATLSPEAGLISAIGTLIVGCFKLIYWAIALIIGIAVCIAFLIGVFLASTYVVNKELLPSAWARTKDSLREVMGSLCYGVIGFFKGRRQGAAQSASPQTDYINETEPQAPQTDDDGAAVCCKNGGGHHGHQHGARLMEEIKKLGESQAELQTQLSGLYQKIVSLEEKNATLADAASQIEDIAGEITASGKAMDQVREHVSALQSKVEAASQKVQNMSMEKLLGDIPARLTGLEKNDGLVALQKDIDALQKSIADQQKDVKIFDPQPLNEGIAALQKDIGKVQQGLAEQNSKAFDPQPLHEAIAVLQKDLGEMKQSLAAQETTEKAFDPQALTESIAALQKDMGELKKKASAVKASAGKSAAAGKGGKKRS